MKKLLTIIGARPQIIKAAALNRAIQNHFKDQLTEVLVHTGQHYDYGMSDVFFEEMNIPKPDYQLSIGSGSHGAQTGKMLENIEVVLQKEQPDALVIYGDTNSTIAGAIAAAKIHVPVIHIEAGLRSFNKRMPEEVNRITADHTSTLLFSPTISGINNLRNEGFLSLEDAKTKGGADIDNPYVFQCGDLMYDNTLHYSKRAEEYSALFDKHAIDKQNFALATIHRPQNTDNEKALSEILSSLNQLSILHNLQFVLPLHPRTAKQINESNHPIFEEIKSNPNLKIIEPVGFLEMVLLEKYGSLVVTDSGGVQKEAFFMKKPCIILRPETEWTEIVECGCALLAGSNSKKIKDSFTAFQNNPPDDFPSIFGNGKAAEFICESIIKYLN